MNYFTLKQYKRNIFVSLVVFVPFSLFFFYGFLYIILDDYLITEEKVILGSSMLIMVLACLFDPSYSIYRYKKLSGLCKYYNKYDGVIEGHLCTRIRRKRLWRWAYLTVRLNDEIFHTKPIFSPQEARCLIGKKVTCAYIEDELFIYEIKN